MHFLLSGLFIYFVLAGGNPYLASTPSGQRKISCFQPNSLLRMKNNDWRDFKNRIIQKQHVNKNMSSAYLNAVTSWRGTDDVLCLFRGEELNWFRVTENFRFWSCRFWSWLSELKPLQADFIKDYLIFISSLQRTAVCSDLLWYDQVLVFTDQSDSDLLTWVSPGLNQLLDQSPEVLQLCSDSLKLLVLQVLVMQVLVLTLVCPGSGRGENKC